MKTRLVTLACAALLGALAGASGCADNRASIQVQYVCSPPTDCDFTSGCDQFIGYVTLDRGLNTTGLMHVYLQVENQLPDNKNVATGRLNTNDAHVDEVVVAFEGLVGGEQSVGLNNFIPVGTVSAVKVPMGLGTAGTGEVLARVRLRGYLEDGSRFETGEFPFTITVCASGCGSSAAACPAGTCPPATTGMSPLVCLQ